MHYNAPRASLGTVDRLLFIIAFKFEIIPTIYIITMRFEPK